MVLILYYYIPRITKFDWSIKKNYDKQHQKKKNWLNIVCYLI